MSHADLDPDMELKKDDATDKVHMRVQILLFMHDNGIITDNLTEKNKYTWHFGTGYNVTAATLGRLANDIVEELFNSGHRCMKEIGKSEKEVVEMIRKLVDDDLAKFFGVAR
ncbi:hypothetical protein L211DRAFT_847070 [Terfezia boudieri ATCC MYA-4762]|uniref:Uncharacterized protein n=1 Tax=Terfezia boudieri ATCC MYA-4762 TaxID=1051890 RepID=A0A3N4LUE0_9PEZI|nr:hypothetical protein L211DRAFT_847070 [Terfezia boudieri ATCC MYA-4762]